MSDNMRGTREIIASLSNHEFERVSKNKFGDNYAKLVTTDTKPQTGYVITVEFDSSLPHYEIEMRVMLNFFNDEFENQTTFRQPNRLIHKGIPISAIQIFDMAKIAWAHGAKEIKVPVL